MEVYRLGQPVEILESPLTIDGEDVLIGCSIDLSFSIADIYQEIVFESTEKNT